MDDQDVGQPADPVYRAQRSTFEIVASKLRPPPARPGAVGRPSLIDRLMRDDCGPIVSVVAPAGYGKTTLLAQWAQQDSQAFAWVSADENDNDPKVLLTCIAEALDAVQPVGEPVFEALASPASSVSGSVVPRLGSAFASMTVPVVLVLDEVHLLRNRECRSALSVLADHVPKGSRLVLAGRTDPPLRVAWLRAEGRLTEIGPADLSLTRREAASLLRNTGVVLGEADLAELYRRTEGWPAGLYLAALAIRAGGSPPGAAMSFDGADRFITEYLESEFLARISRRQREFLTRTAVLERMSGPLCEAVLERSGAAADLAGLARSNLLLVPLDRRGRWYRYHHLFRDMLRAELERTEPALMPVLRRRAANWCLRNDRPEEALEYSMAAGDADTAARLVEKLAVPARRQGRLTTVQRWFGWLDERGRIEGHPAVMALAALIYAWMGRPAEADRWADAVDRWQYGNGTRPRDPHGARLQGPHPTRPDDPNPTRPDDPHVEAWAALARAMLCRNGVTQMLADTDEAIRRFPEAGIVTSGPALLLGVALILSGDLDGADVALADAVSLGQETGAHEVAAEALGERSLVAIARGEWDRAEVLAGQARATLRRAGLEESYVAPLVCAAQARVAIHRGDGPAARQELASAQRVRPLLTYAIPHVAVQARIELIRVYLALADVSGARTLMREIDEVLRRRPGLGTAAGEARALRIRMSTELGPSAAGASSLTSAELRVLPLLATHLSFPEIGAELFLSPNTVKSQAVSLYRKLGASSRSQAVARARELALLEG